MKIAPAFIVAIVVLAACETKQPAESQPSVSPLAGTWQLITGTLVEKGDTTVTEYTKDKKFLKVINDTHFSFVGHDLNNGKDSASAFYTSGSGTYTLKDSAYTEHLEFCSDRAWENHDFDFTITLSNDTLVQRGVEKVEATGVNRLNIEKYVRVKK